MSNSTVSSQVVERFSRDLFELRRLHDLTRLSPAEMAHTLRSPALDIQSRWAPFEGLGRVSGPLISKAFGVETLAIDIQNYLAVNAKRIASYLSTISGALVLLRSRFPTIQDDHTLAASGLSAFSPDTHAAATTVRNFLNVVDSNYAGGYPITDTRDIDRLGIELDEGFHETLKSLEPSARLGAQRFYMTESDEVYDASIWQPVGSLGSVTSAAANGTLALGDEVAIIFAAAMAAPTALVLGNLIRDAHVIVRVKIPTTFRTAANAEPVLTDFQLSGVNAVFADASSKVTIGGYFIFHLETYCTAGIVSLIVTGGSAAAYRDGFAKLVHITGMTEAAPYYSSTPDETVLEAVANGRVNYFTRAFALPSNAKLLKYVSRRDFYARQSATPRLSTIIKYIWDTAARGANQVGLVGALANIEERLLYSPSFWGADPLQLGPVINPLDFSTPWIKDAYDAMYRAFYAYLEAMANASLVDEHMRHALEEV